MITLKDYQKRVLTSLSGFFRQCSRDGHPEAAFQAVQRKNGRNPAPYIPVVATGLSREMPYACLRVPTGGGKTLLACHAASLAVRELLHAERGVVLWLVPSNTILDQTADALRDPRHPYRRALEQGAPGFPGLGSVEVVTIEEALRLSRATVEGQTVVIVSTIQAFRVEDTTGRNRCRGDGGAGRVRLCRSRSNHHLFTGQRGLSRAQNGIITADRAGDRSYPLWPLRRTLLRCRQREPPGSDWPCGRPDQFDDCCVQSHPDQYS